MFCLLCGTPYEDGDAFCEGCGQLLDAPKYTPCAHCGQLSDDAGGFCEFCGKKVNGISAGLQQPVLPGGAGPGYGFPPQAPMAAPVARQPAFIPQMQISQQSRMLLVFLLDASASAAPHYFQMVVELSKFILDVNADGAAQSVLDMALIQFNDNHEVLQDLPDITNANVQPRGNAAYSAPIKEALRIVDEYALSNVRSYKPWVILISSSDPSDDISAVATEVQNKQRADKLRFMGLSIDGHNSASLKKLTDVVFRQKGSDFASFFEWVSKCVKVIARTTLNEKPRLPQLEGNVYREK